MPPSAEFMNESAHNVERARHMQISPELRADSLALQYDAKRRELDARDKRSRRTDDVLAAYSLALTFSSLGAGLIGMAGTVIAQKLGKMKFTSYYEALDAWYDEVLDKLVEENPELKSYLQNAGRKNLKTERSRQKYSGRPS